MTSYVIRLGETDLFFRSSHTTELALAIGKGNATQWGNSESAYNYANMLNRAHGLDFKAEPLE